MKKSLLALAVLGAFAGAASAQSSVTVYGIVDLGFTNVDNGSRAGSITGINSGNQSASRIGFRGTEDLGNGLNALFQLEAGIAADNGAAFVAATNGSNAGGFNRIATVGLQSAAFGAVNLGRQTAVNKDAYDQIDPFGDGGSIAPIGQVFFNGALAGDFGRISNSVKYSTPSFGGFKLSAAYGFGETAGDTSANSSYGFGAGYVNGPLNVQLGYHNVDFSAPASITALNATTISETEALFLGATYNFGVVKLHAAVAESELDNVALATPDTKFRNYMIGVSTKLGAAGNLFASYSVNDNRTTNDADAQRAAIMYTYDLSKRTNLYTGYSHTSNDNGSRIGLFGTTAGTPANMNAPAGESASSLAVGVRHRF